MRTWTDATGTYTVVAALVDADEGKVRLKRPDGMLIVVPMQRLSLADLRYVREELKRRLGQGGSTPGTAAPGSSTQPTTRPGDWPGWRGPNRDGKSPDTGLLKQWPEGGPPRLWHVRGIGEGYSSVAVVDGLVYITGKVDDTLVLTALDMEGKHRWKVPLGPAFTKSHPGARSTPMIDQGNLYLVTGVGLIVCCDAKSGRNKWTRRMSDFGGKVPGWGYAESVLILGNLAVVTPGGANCIVALDKQSGRPVWSSRGFDAGAQYSSCIAFEHQGTPLVVNGTHKGIVGVDARNGKVLWSDDFSAGNTANCPTPVYENGYVFWANGYGKGGVCLKLGPKGTSAARAWTTREMVCHHGGYIVHEGYLYGNNGSGWACLELTTGRVMWQERAVGKGSVCFADNMLYLFGESGGRVGLATCSPQGLEMRGEFRVEGEGPSWAHPVVIGGRLYVRYADNLYCFDVKTRD